MSRWLLLLVTVVMGALGFATACGSEAATGASKQGTMHMVAKVSSAVSVDPSLLTVRVHGERTDPASPAETLDFDITPSGTPVTFTATRTNIPVGTWAFSASADTGTPSNPAYQTLADFTVSIDVSSTQTVALILYEVGGEDKDFANHQPRSLGFGRGGEGEVNPLATINLTTAFYDADFTAGPDNTLASETLTVVWSATCGTLGTASNQGNGEMKRLTSSNTWQAPSTPGECEITVIATDSKDARAGSRVTLTVGNPTATFTASIRNYPQVENLVPLFDGVPPILTVEDSVTLEVTATDADNDTLTVEWSSACGTFTEAQTTLNADGRATAVFRSTGATPSGECAVVATVSDGTAPPSGLSNTGTLYLQVQQNLVER